MSVNSKKSIGWSIILVLLGVVTICTGVKSLFLAVPAAIFVWYGALPAFRGGRN